MKIVPAVYRLFRVRIRNSEIECAKTAGAARVWRHFSDRYFGIGVNPILGTFGVGLWISKADDHTEEVEA